MDRPLCSHADEVWVAAYAPHYLQKTRSQRATPEMILDGKHFPQWLEAIRDAVTYIAERPGIDARRIGVLGVSLEDTWQWRWGLRTGGRER